MVSQVSGEPKSVQAVERACDVLFALAASQNGAGITEIASNLDLCKSAVHRIMVALGKKSLVQHDPLTQRYSLAPKILELTSLMLGQMDMVGISRPFLDRLRDQFSETAVFDLRIGFTFMAVTYSPSPFEHRMTPGIGKRYSLYIGSFGKAILAQLPPDEVDNFFREARLVAITDKTVVDPGEILNELALVRQRGYAMSVGEMHQGVIGVAAAVLDPSGNPIGAIGIGGPEFRLRQFDLDQAGRQVAVVAQQLSAALSLGV